MRWNTPEAVAGFLASPPNAALIDLAEQLQTGAQAPMQALDIGCGAGRNAVPLAGLGLHIVGTDLSVPMLEGALARARAEGVGHLAHFVRAPMDHLPVPDRAFDLVIAHGIWNLARSGSEFRAAVHEAARAAKPGASLFVFTFSRHTLPEALRPVDGETFVFTEFAGEPQCFLTDEQLVNELAAAGFEADPLVPLVELNRPASAAFRSAGPPVIYQATFLRKP